MSRKHSARSQACRRVTTVTALWGWYGPWSILRIHLMFSGVLPCLKVIYSPFWSTPVFLLSLFRSEFLLLISFWCIKLLNPFPKTTSVASSLLLYSFAVLVIFVIFARGDRILPYGVCLITWHLSCQTYLIFWCMCGYKSQVTVQCFAWDCQITNI